MPQVQYWARVRAGMDCPLRRGAWYRVVDLTPGDTVLEVNSRLLRVPRAFLQILPLPPHVVAHPSQARRSGPDLRGWQIRRVSELLRAQPGGRLRADPALSALRRRVRDRVVGLTLAGLRSAPGATATWQAGARPRGGAARARHGVRPASVKDKSVKDK